MGQLSDLQCNDVRAVLLSASPDQYVSQIASILKFDYAAGTRSANTLEKYRETRGEYKVQILKELLPDNSVIESVFTDHHDDFEVIKYCSEATVCLVNPSKKLKALCDSNNINYKINIQHD